MTALTLLSSATNNSLLSFSILINLCNSFKQGTSICLINLLGMFDILTQQEIAKGKPYTCQSNCLNIAQSITAS